MKKKYKLLEARKATNARRNKRKAIKASIKKMNKERTTKGQFNGLCQSQGLFLQYWAKRYPFIIDAIYRGKGDE